MATKKQPARDDMPDHPAYRLFHALGSMVGVAITIALCVIKVSVVAGLVGFLLAWMALSTITGAAIAASRE